MLSNVARLTLAAIACMAILGFNVGDPKLQAANLPVPLKVGFILPGPIADCGYSTSHDEARRYLQAHIKGIQTTVVEKVPENAEVERVMEKMIAQGTRLIFSTSFGYLEPAERVAKRHPDVTIMQTWRTSPLKNIGFYAAVQYEPLYAIGMVAGRMTKTNHLGLIAGMPLPIIIQCVNAFTLGARAVNPKVKVHVIWTNSWSDPPTEAEATRSLVDNGVDVVSSFLDGPLTVARAAQKAHIMVVGSQTDFQKLMPECWLTGERWNWANVYAPVIKAVTEGTWKKDERWLGLKDGAVEMCPFGKSVPQAVQKEAGAVEEQVRSGKKNIFKGPLKDRDGKLRLAAGQIADPKVLAEMNWFVQGVEGSLPRRQ